MNIIVKCAATAAALAALGGCVAVPYDNSGGYGAANYGYSAPAPSYPAYGYGYPAVGVYPSINVGGYYGRGYYGGHGGRGWGGRGWGGHGGGWHR